ncbi:hypothetical protein GIB67_039232, partial [Kingdonia uniflora]
MKQMLKRPSTSRTTGSGEAMEKRRVEPFDMSGVMVVEDRPVMEDDLIEVEEKARLAVLHGEEGMRKMAARLMKGICLGVEEERVVLKRKKVELERNVARFKTDILKEGKWMEALKALQVVEIHNLHAEAKTNLEEVEAERDRLGHHLMSTKYSKDEVDAIRADTYVKEEEDEKIEYVVVGLDGVSPLTELKGIRLRIKDLEAELAKERDASASLLSSQAELQVELESTRLRKSDACQ